MKLVRLELIDWRKFSNGPHVIVFDPRATVLIGPNEAGKSTIFEAIRRVLFDRCHSTARWVRRIIPYGVDGAVPTVRLEFEHNRGRWRIEKRFGGTNGTATLSELRDGKWRQIARNKEADDRLRELLGAKFSAGPAGTKSENWGAFQWLFVPQDERGLPEDRSSALGYLGLSQAGVSDEFKAVSKLIEEVYRESFTPTGLVSKKSLQHQLEEELHQMRREQEEVEALMRELDEKRRRYNEIQGQLPTLEQEAEQAKKEWDEAIQERVTLSEAEGKLKSAEATYNEKKHEYEDITRVLDERLNLENDVEEAERELTTAIHQRAAAFAEHDRLQNKLAEKREEIRKLEAALALSRHVLADASVLMSIREKQVEKKRLAQVIAQVKKFDEEIQQLTTELSGGETPSAEVIEQATRLSAQLEARRTAMKSFALRVRVTGDPKLEVQLDGERLMEQEGIALREVIITAPGGGSVRIDGDTSRAQHLANEAEDIARKIETLLKHFGVTSLRALRMLREERLKKENRLNALTGGRNALDKRPLTEIKNSLAAIEKEIESLIKKRRLNGVIDEHDVLSNQELNALITHLENETSDLSQRLNLIRAEANKLDERLKNLDKAVLEADGDYRVAKERKELAESALDRHRDLYGSIAKCRADAERAKQELNEAKMKFERVRCKLVKLSNDAETRCQTAQNKYERLRKLVEEHRAQAAELARQLEKAADQGYYTRAGELERRISSEEARLARIKLRTNAVKLLKITVEEVRSSAIRTVVNPIKGDLETMLAIATRGRYTLADINDKLDPERLQGNVECNFEDGSQGLHELVYTLLRLSVANHLAKNEPQTIILDDPCVHVSRERTARLVEIINRMTNAGTLQAIIFTHRENEFAGIEGNFVSLENL